MPKPRPTSSSRPTSTRTFAQFGALAAGALALLGSLSLEGCRKHDGTKPQPQVVTAAPSATPVLATSQQPGGTTALSDAPAGIDWLPGDHVEAAFAQARAAQRPVLLYWGAVWCPYCKDLKASVFSRPDFKEKLRLFVPVYLDGDTEGAQKWGERFRIAGYPTVLVLNGDQTELARIAGGMDLNQYANILDLVLGNVMPIDALLSSALEANTRLSADECHRLAYNAWELDPTLDADATRLAKSLDAASQRCPTQSRTQSARLTVIAAGLAASSQAKAFSSGKPPSANLKQLIARTDDILNEREWGAANADALQYLDEDFFQAIALAGPGRAGAWLSRWAATMDAVAIDPHYTPGAQLAAINGKLVAAKVLTPSGKLAPELVADAKHRIEVALEQTHEPMARAGVVNAALNVLGTLDDSERAYEIAAAEMQNSKTPYYYLGDMAYFAEKLGRKDEAVALLERAYDESKGAASRFQWGTNYVLGLIRIRPHDESAIQGAALKVLTELDGPDRLYSRSRTRLDQISSSLKQWNAGGKHERAIVTIRVHMDRICEKISDTEPAKQSCKGFLA